MTQPCTLLLFVVDCCLSRNSNLSHRASFILRPSLPCSLPVFQGTLIFDCRPASQNRHNQLILFVYFVCLFMFYVVYIFTYCNIMKPQCLLSRKAMRCIAAFVSPTWGFFLYFPKLRATYNNPTVRNFSGI